VKKPTEMLSIIDIAAVVYSRLRSRGARTPVLPDRDFTGIRPPRLGSGRQTWHAQTRHVGLFRLGRLQERDICAVGYTHESRAPSLVVHIVRDGEARWNPGRAGWCVLIRQNGKFVQFWGRYQLASNNAMELRAAVEALRDLPKGMRVWISTDSTYLKRDITEWVPNWQWNGRRNKHMFPEALVGRPWF
jgi:hypothetical protein